MSDAPPAIRVVTLAELPPLDEERHARFASAWPAFMLHDPVCDALWHHLTEDFRDFQVYLLDAEDQIIAFGNTVPIPWDGTVAGLPGGVDGALQAAAAALGDATPFTALCAIQAVVRPDLQGRGMSAGVLRAMVGAGRVAGFDALVAPVRPTLKPSYPLIPIERYAAWRRADGLPLDPWLRVHARLGAEILGIAQRSMVIDGTVADWERWTGMAFPESGTYVVPGACVPVEIDVEAGRGRYVEPNVWMGHRLTPAGA